MKRDHVFLSVMFGRISQRKTDPNVTGSSKVHTQALIQANKSGADLQILLLNRFQAMLNFLPIQSGHTYVCWYERESQGRRLRLGLIKRPKRGSQQRHIAHMGTETRWQDLVSRTLPCTNVMTRVCFLSASAIRFLLKFSKPTLE